MKQFTIVTDASCDLPAQIAEACDLRVMPMFVYVDGQQYFNDLDGSDLSSDRFYEYLTEDRMITTSAANLDQFRTVFESELLRGKDVLYIGFSSTLSGTFNTATLAARELSSRYPKRKILLCDSLSASLGQGYLVYLAARERAKGKTIEEVHDIIEDRKLHVCHWFTVADLKHLKRGGRIGSVSAFIGTVLSLKPILHIDAEGRLVSVGKARGRNASINTLFEKLGTGYDLNENNVFISHAACPEDAAKLADMVEKKYGFRPKISQIGPAIGTHVGRETLSIFFLSDER